MFRCQWLHSGVGSSLEVSVKGSVGFRDKIRVNGYRVLCFGIRVRVYS